MIKTLIVSLTMFCSAANAQDFITISGTVTDAETQEPLSSASITVKNKSVGTIANTEGKFTIHLPSELKADTLYISMIGYHSLQVPVASVRGELTIKLKPSVQYLQEVVVSDSLSTEAILKRVHERIRSNYSFKSFSLTGFYREVQKADSTYVSLLEASATVYSDGYKNQRHEKLKVDQLRKSLTYNHPLATFWNETNLLWSLLGQNFMKYESSHLIKHKKAYRKENIFIDGIQVYVIAIDIEGWFWPTILYVRCDNFAVIRMQEVFDHSVDGENVWKVFRNPLVESHAQTKFLEVDFKEYQGKYYPGNYAMKFYTFYKDALTGKKLLEFSMEQQFAVTDINIQDPVDVKDGLGKEDNLQKLLLPYDSSFWKNYNVVQDTPLDSAIQRGLEQRMNSIKN